MNDKENKKKTATKTRLESKKESEIRDHHIAIVTCFPKEKWDSYNKVYKLLNKKLNKLDITITESEYELYIHMIFSKLRRVISPKIKLDQYLNRIQLDNQVHPSFSTSLFLNQENCANVLHFIEKTQEWDENKKIKFESLIRYIEKRDMKDNKFMIADTILSLLKCVRDNKCLTFDYTIVNMNESEETKRGDYICQWTGKKLTVNQRVYLFTVYYKKEENDESVLEKKFYISEHQNNTHLYINFLCAILNYRYLTRRFIYHVKKWKNEFSYLGEYIETEDILLSFCEKGNLMYILNVMFDVYLIEKVFEKMINLLVV